MATTSGATSLNNGSSEIPPDVVRQEPRIGGSGLVEFGGILYNMADYNPALQGQAAMSVYEEMSTDPEIGAGISRIIWPLLAAKWEIEPVDDSDEEVEIAEFCEKWIMGRGRTDLGAPRWQNTLRHALLSLTFGFSAFEKVWGVDQEGNQVYANLFGILPKSVFDFVFETDGTGRLNHLHQRAWTVRGFKEARVPAEKVLLFTFAQEANNLWGKSILRNCYKPWYHKDKLLRVDGMRHERHGLGFTTITVDAGAGDTVKSAAETIVREARANERGYAVLETGQVVAIDYPRGQGTDVIGSVKYHDVQMAQVLFSEVMHVLSGSLGAKGANESKVDFVLAVLQGLATGVAEVFSTHAIPELVARNRGARAAYPMMKCEDLSKLSGTAMAETLAKLLPTGSGAINPNVDLEQHLREGYDWPLIPEEIVTVLKQIEKEKAQRALEMAKRPIPEPVLPGAGVAASSANGNGGGDPKGVKPSAADVKQPQEKVAAAEPVMANPNGALRRDPFPHEAYVAAAETAGWLDVEPERIWYRVVAPYRKVQIEKIAKAASAVSDEDFKAGRIFPAGDPPPLMRRHLTKDLAKALERVYARGRAAVVVERSRQLAGAPVVARTMQEGDDVDLEPTKVQRQWVEATAATFVSLMLASLTSEALRVLKVARNADLKAREQEAAVRDALGDLSVPVQIANLGGAVVQTYTNGRNEQADSMREQVETAFYSAIMDVNTCGPCSALDGEEHEPGDDTFTTPNPDCEGGDRCRCITVYVWREEAA